MSQATVELVSARGDGSRIISIESTGQISIKREAEETDGGTDEEDIPGGELEAL
jgi:hypothetical protein